MSELRQDRTTGKWVIVAPERGRRPDTLPTVRKSETLPRVDPACPFCPGHEAALPAIIAETRAAGDPGWSVRVVPNKFPALAPTAAVPVAGRHQARAAYGLHEVVIENPLHNADLTTLSAAERQAVVLAYRDRCRLAFEQPAIETVILFRNHGSTAGASLRHPHSQMIALGLLPPRLASLIDWGRAYDREHGCCATCETVQIESSEGTRVVDENAGFIAMVPYAAEYPFELWVVPKRHQASFTVLDEGELQEFGALLSRSLRRLKTALDDPPYNFVIDSAPRHAFEAADFHWRLRIAPDVAPWGGFELGTGLPINASSPEESASRLRAASTDDERAS